VRQLDGHALADTQSFPKEAGVVRANALMSARMSEEPTPPALPAPVIPKPPQLWTAIVVPLAAMAAAILVSSLIIGVGVGVQTVMNSSTDGDFDPETIQFDLFTFVESLPLALMLIVPPQLVMAAAALGAAALSLEPLPRRLGWTRSRLPWWSLPLLIAGTGFSGMLGGLALEYLVGDEGDSLKLMMHMFLAQEGVNFWILAATVALLPGLIEETLFRGYVQRRLLQRWKPVHAIALSTLLFCAIHFDPAHMLAIAPLGVWLGVVAWRSGSIWPAVLCHMAQNLFASLMARHSVAESTWGPELAIVLGVTFLGLLGAIWVMRRHPPEDLQTPPAQPTVISA
jgi:hypothetical protein